MPKKTKLTNKGNTKNLIKKQSGLNKSLQKGLTKGKYAKKIDQMGIGASKVFKDQRLAFNFYQAIRRSGLIAHLEKVNPSKFRVKIGN